MSGIADQTWMEATSYANELQSATGDGVCIAIAHLEDGQVSRHFAGDCDAESLFQIGSITKTFTGVLLADAVISGRLTLDMPVSDLYEGALPEPRGRPITLLDLATHSSGLPRLPDNLVLNEETGSDPYLSYGAPEIAAFLAGHELARAPEAEVEYSNLGMGLLGFLLASEAGRSYGELVGERVAAPLGMTDTVAAPAQVQLARVTKGHTAGGEEVPLWGFDALAGAGALYSTLEDMVRYLQANLAAPSGPLGEALALASRAHRPAEPLGGEIGLGWIRWQREGMTGVWHDGGTAGHRSFAGFLPGAGQGAVVLASASLEEVGAIGAYLLGAAAGLPPLATALVEDGPHAAYVGNYTMTPSFAIRMTSDGETLYGQATGQPRFRTRPLTDDRHTIEGVAAEILFNRNKAGVVESLTLFQNGLEQMARKEGVEIGREVAAVTLETLRRYPGRYQLAPNAILAVTLQGAELSIQLSGQPAFSVYPRSDTRFYYEVVDAEVEFNLDSSGRVTSLTLYQNGVHEARRLAD